MSTPMFFRPPVYQHSPPGVEDYIGPTKVPPGGTGGGTKTLTGSGPPSDALGNDGDTYIALDPNGQAVTFYGQKSGGHWPTVGTSLVGPAGPPGPAAPPAATISGGNGPPDANNVGVVGSIYLDRASSAVDLYQAQA